MGKKAIIALLISLVFPSGGFAEAQQRTAKIPTIGFLTSGTSSGSLSVLRSEVFRQQLRELGYVEGKNIAFEARYGEDNFDRLTALADELVRLTPTFVLPRRGEGIRALPPSWLLHKSASSAVQIQFFEGVPKPVNSSSGQMNQFAATLYQKRDAPLPVCIHKLQYS